jgi:hypothetical protein
MTLNYILGGPDGHQPIPEPDLIAWGRWFEASLPKRRVARTELPNGAGYISTVFLGIDHAFRSDVPVLFETMAFIGDDGEQYFDRYTTWEEAEAGHWLIVGRALADLADAANLIDRTLAIKATNGNPE